MEFGSTIAILFASSAITAASPALPGAEPSSKARERGAEPQRRTAPVPGLKEIPTSATTEKLR
jgi:hypothetical protein